MTMLITALLFFAAWTVLHVLMIGFHRWKCVFTGTVPKEGFPSDVPPPDGWYRRVLQAHRNCIENLAVFGAITLVVSHQGLSSPMIDNFAIAIIVGRVLQSLIHVWLVQTRPVVMVRFTFYLVQVVSYIGLMVIAFEG